jgi:hypothetical protein
MKVKHCTKKVKSCHSTFIYSNALMLFHDHDCMCSKMQNNMKNTIVDKLNFYNMNVYKTVENIRIIRNTSLHHCLSLLWLSFTATE